MGPERAEVGGGASRSADAELPRPERKRQRRAREFLEAAQHIVFREGFDGLTMSRLASQLDTVDSAVYRYFPSKGALVAAIQHEAIERLDASLDAILARADEAFSRLEPAIAALARVVLVGRWFCASSEVYPEELRLFEMIMSRNASALDADGGRRIFPVAMGLLTKAVGVIEGAQAAGELRPGNATDRTIIWAAALGGVLQTDDLEHYAPELFGHTRLALQANRDLLVGWGADPARIEAAERAVDALAADGPLSP
jgi:AcrR family transcriptional regulator